MSATSSSEERTARWSWKVEDMLQIYSESRSCWYSGEILKIFDDEEGEWLEIRYNRTMSKQVQRYSKGIKPTTDQLKRAGASLSETKAPKHAAAAPDIVPKCDEKEAEIRAKWAKGDKLEIFSNTHQEWHIGQVLDVVTDAEGEWLDCLWHRDDGHAIAKQVERFCPDVRPLRAFIGKGSAKKRKSLVNEEGIV